METHRIPAEILSQLNWFTAQSRSLYNCYLLQIILHGLDCSYFIQYVHIYVTF